MSLRLSRVLLVALLVFGQVGGWLHGLTHFAAPAVASGFESSAGGNAPAAPADASDDVCLVCLTAAALGLAVVSSALVFALAGLSFALPAAFRRLSRARRGFARSARGPPVFS